jgi:threonine dehydrogenase-like Zn-dependent dehydrogenase
MKALAWFGPKDVRMVEVPIPDITEPDDVIVKVTGTTICGSDLHLYHGEILALQKGDILGHEVRFNPSSHMPNGDILPE